MRSPWCIGAIATLIVQCSADINVGRNALPPVHSEEKKKQAEEGQNQNEQDPKDESQKTESTDATDAAAGRGNTKPRTSSPDGTTGTAVAPRTAGCFGADEPNEALKSFCQNVSAQDRADFAKLIKVICVDNKVSNLFFDGCSWEGQGPAKKFMKVLEKTDLQDRSVADFYYQAVYSMTVKNSVEKNKENNSLAYLDPATYATIYRLPGNTKLKNGARNAAGHIEYDLESVSSTSVAKFHGLLEQLDFGTDLFVTMDRSVRDTVTIKDHKMISFYWRLPDGRTRIVAINEKLFPTGGLHDIAFSLLYNLDIDRMEIFYDNSQH